MEHNTIESQLFTWEDWDEAGDFSQQFYNCVAVIDFGPFKKGENIGIIVMDYENSELSQWSEDGNKLLSLKLKIAVE